MPRSPDPWQSPVSMLTRRDPTERLDALPSYWFHGSERVVDGRINPVSDGIARLAGVVTCPGGEVKGEIPRRLSGPQRAPSLFRVSPTAGMVRLWDDEW